MDALKGMIYPQVHLSTTKGKSKIRQHLLPVRLTKGAGRIEVTTSKRDPWERELDQFEIRLLGALLPEAVNGPRVVEVVDALEVAAKGDREQLITHRLVDARALPEPQPLIVAEAAYSLWGHSATSERDAREKDPDKKQHVSRVLTLQIVEAVGRAKLEVEKTTKEKKQ